MSVLRVIKKFRILMNPKQKRRIVALVFLMVVGGLLELLNVSAIVGFVNMIVNIDDVMNNEVVVHICGNLGIDKATDFLFLVAILMGALYLLKNLYLILQLYIHNRYVYSWMLDLQSELLDSFLHKPYSYYFTASSGEIVRIIGEDCKLTFVLLSSILTFMIEIIVTIILSIGLFVLSPMITLIIAGVLCALLICIMLILKPSITRFGKTNQRTFGEMNNWVLQSIEGIKEIKVLKRESYFKSNFEKIGIAYVKSLRNYYSLESMPRFLIEAICMGAFFIIAGILIKNGHSLTSMLPIISGIGVASIRLLPAANRISVTISNASFYEPRLDKIMEIKRDMDSIRTSTIDSEMVMTNLNDCISFKNITYSYPESERKILDEANMSIKKGMSIGIVGASGEGKTTSMDLLLGLISPQSGAIYIDDKKLDDCYSGWLDMVGYVPQTIFMINGSVRDNIAFGEDREKIDEEKLEKAIKDASLYDFIQELPDGLETVIGERGIRISGGQRQRIGIARALYRNPQVMIFDEATSSLDNDTEAAIIESIEKLHGEKTMIIIAHRLSTIEKCDVIYRVEHGKLIAQQ